MVLLAIGALRAIQTKAITPETAIHGALGTLDSWFRMYTLPANGKQTTKSLICSNSSQFFSHSFQELGVDFIKKPDDGRMKGLAFIKDPDGYWIEIFNAHSVPN